MDSPFSLQRGIKKIFTQKRGLLKIYCKSRSPLALLCLQNLFLQCLRNFSCYFTFPSTSFIFRCALFFLSVFPPVCVVFSPFSSRRKIQHRGEKNMERSIKRRAGAVEFLGDAGSYSLINQQQRRLNSLTVTWGNSRNVSLTHLNG